MNNGKYPFYFILLFTKLQQNYLSFFLNFQKKIIYIQLYVLMHSNYTFHVILSKLKINTKKFLLASKKVFLKKQNLFCYYSSFNKSHIFFYVLIFYKIKQIHFNFLLTPRELKKKWNRIFHHLYIIKSKEEETQIIIRHWIRKFSIKLGWIKDFDKIVVNYVSSFILSFLKYQSKYYNII
ncbi:hypothetical protein RFI_01678 [Reticulomyxa filosa]|uniref:Uncharacterized protein n=1 Tax=Reticulomyxa filosa TaxID=46433 RepID=X6PA42_RETFI|nr:hypothetical protein RFI_01678 [Reticulomyxa filosa]|eukprot:ETO35385.1 hypothetical protein RFI_01678 [Reticulomyxa filosa]